MTVTGDERNDRLDGPIHLWFGLTYSNYLVLHRTMMQSMPVEWQTRAVALFDELDQAFPDLDRAASYIVEPAREAYYCELGEPDLQRLDITREDDRYLDHRGDEHDGYDRVLVPMMGDDPVPHYNRGRTFIEPTELMPGSVR